MPLDNGTPCCGRDRCIAHRLLYLLALIKAAWPRICTYSCTLRPAQCDKTMVTHLQEQLFLSLTSLFNAHLLPRSLSTSPETLLTVMALYNFPFPAPAVPKVNGLQNVTNLKPIKSSRGETGEGMKELMGVEDSEKSFYGVNDLDYVVIDRAPPFVVNMPL